MGWRNALGCDTPPSNINVKPAVRSKTTHIPAIPSLYMDEDYNRLWRRAEALADWIDDPDAAPLENRRQRLPELMTMSERLGQMEAQGQKDFHEEPMVAKMTTCFHGAGCYHLKTENGRQICKRAKQPVFELDICPENKWFKANQYNEDTHQ